MPCRSPISTSRRRPVPGGSPHRLASERWVRHPPQHGRGLSELSSATSSRTRCGRLCFAPRRHDRRQGSRHERLVVIPLGTVRLRDQLNFCGFSIGIPLGTQPLQNANLSRSRTGEGAEGRTARAARSRRGGTCLTAIGASGTRDVVTRALSPEREERVRFRIHRRRRHPRAGSQRAFDPAHG